MLYAYVVLLLDISHCLCLQWKRPHAPSESECTVGVCGSERQFSLCLHVEQWRTQKIFMGGFIQWHMVVIYIWCALFVTSQFDAISMFPNQRFGEVC